MLCALRCARFQPAFADWQQQNRAFPCDVRLQKINLAWNSHGACIERRKNNNERANEKPFILHVNLFVPACVRCAYGFRDTFMLRVMCRWKISTFIRSKYDRRHAYVQRQRTLVHLWMTIRLTTAAFVGTATQWQCRTLFDIVIVSVLHSFLAIFLTEFV